MISYLASKNVAAIQDEAIEMTQVTVKQSASVSTTLVNSDIKKSVVPWNTQHTVSLIYMYTHQYRHWLVRYNIYTSRPYPKLHHKIKMSSLVGGYCAYTKATKCSPLSSLPTEPSTKQSCISGTIKCHFASDSKQSITITLF